MGCDSYEVGRSLGGGRWDTVNVKFSEVDDDIGCLCTFPHNYEADPQWIGPNEVRSMAMLGAMVVLAHQGRLPDEFNYIPGDLPEWVRQRIDALVPDPITPAG